MFFKEKKAERTKSRTVSAQRLFAYHHPSDASIRRAQQHKQIENLVSELTNITGRQYEWRDVNSNKFQLFDMRADNPSALPEQVLCCYGRTVFLERFKDYIETEKVLHLQTS